MTVRLGRHAFALTSRASSHLTTRLSSLVEVRQGKDRLYYRLKGISRTDAERVLAELKTVLTREQGGQSGVVWGSITRVVTEHYAERLDYLQFLLSPEAGFVDAAEQPARARAQLFACSRHTLHL
jgi:hypothetical protein